LPSDTPWKHSLKHERDKYAHPNSLYAKGKDNPALLEKIVKGMKEADEDLRQMNDWARKGFLA
jgi:hypothetical protein